MEEIVHKIDNIWYFWDETWSNEYGPYDTEKLARKAWQEYCRENELEL